MLSAEEVHSQSDFSRRLGKIPVRNLWLLMLYASDLYRHLGTKKVTVEDNPEDIADLVAEILCHQVEERLMQNLSYGYESKIAVINRVRGRIDILQTERQRLFEKGKVCCHFDELTIDTPRNRYVRSALEHLTKHSIKATLAYKCRVLMLRLERLGVSKEKPISYRSKSERFGHHDIGDQKMVAAADLAYSLALPTEIEGTYHLHSPSQNAHWLRNLFEAGIRGFYQVNLARSEYYVYPSNKQLNWAINHTSEKGSQLLPTMEIDIEIMNLNSNKKLIIDTKFNEITSADTRFGQSSRKFRSHYIYQMYTYLRSQEDPNDNQSLTSTGMLLHPEVDEEITEMVTIQGHPIWFCTINLGEHSQNIRNRLLSLQHICMA
ncbi:MAG: 5-methylcytosine-specific restriction endonuclease system specificity protein McrC [Parvibaculales bacterium]